MSVPDSDRYVAYAPVSPTTTFPVPWTVYGDPEDSDLFEVRHDGEIVDPDDYTFSGTTDHALSPAQTINGNIVFAVGLTGDVTIEGDRPPDRLSSFTEGVGIPARSHNAVLDATTATQRETWQKVRRIRLEELPDLDERVDALEEVAIGNGNFVVATEQEALAGENNTKGMTPLRVMQAIRNGHPVNLIRDFGAVGDGDEDNTTADTDAWTECLQAMREATEGLSEHLPGGGWADPVGGRPFYNLGGRPIEGIAGKTFCIESELNYSGIFGLAIRDTSFIARDGGNWSATKSLLKCPSVSSFSGFSFPAQTAGLMFDNVTIECNGLCNGLYDIGGRLNTYKFMKIWGFSAIANGWGMFIDGGLEYRISDCKVYGESVMTTAVPPTPNSATGMLLDLQDSEVVFNKVFRAGTGIKLTEPGITFTNNHIHAFAETADAPSLVIDKTTVALLFLHSNYFDSGPVWIRGPRFVQIGPNEWALNSISGMPTMTHLVHIEPRSANEVLEDFMMDGNQSIVPAQAPSVGATFDRIISLGATADPGGGLPYFGDLRYVKVPLATNLFKSTTSNPRGPWPGATLGQLSVTCASADFTSTTTVVDLTNFILMPNAANAPFRAIIQGVKTSDNTVQVPTSWSYDRSTGKLSMTFAAAFTGVIQIDFKWGEQDRVLASAAS